MYLINQNVTDYVTACTILACLRYSISALNYLIKSNKHGLYLSRAGGSLNPRDESVSVSPHSNGDAVFFFSFSFYICFIK